MRSPYDDEEEMPAKTNHGDRIATLEEGYKSLGREIHALRGDLSDFASDIRNQISRQQQSFAEARKTPWGALAGLAGVVVALVSAIVTLGASGPLRDLDRHDSTISALRARMDAVGTTRFTSTDGKELAAEMRGEIAQLDTQLQREMRDLDRVSETRLNHLDTTLQREMRMLVQPIDRRLQVIEKNLASRGGERWNKPDMVSWQRDVYHRDLIEIKKAIEVLRTRIHEHQKDGHPNRVLERIDGLKARIDAIAAEQGKRSSHVYKVK